MPKLAKKARHNRELADRYEGPQTPEKAIAVVKEFQGRKFDESVEVCVHLGIDPRHADQQIRGSIAMPKGVGKTARVICFCGNDKVDAAKEAGAIEAGNEDLTKKIKDGWMDFDVAVASPDMMKFVGQLGRVLGPKGLMPSPKAGTVTPDILNAVKEYVAGKLEYRNDDGGNIHCLIGKMSFSEDDLLANFNHFIGVIEKVRPASTKGMYIKKCTVSGTMTPGIQVAV